MTEQDTIDTGDKVWVPLDELETYFNGLSTTLLQIVSNIEATVETMRQTVEDQKGETNDDN